MSSSTHIWPWVTLKGLNPDFNWFSLQQWVFDTSLQKIANVIPTAAVKQRAKVLGPVLLNIEHSVHLSHKGWSFDELLWLFNWCHYSALPYQLWHLPWTPWLARRSLLKLFKEYLPSVVPKAANVTTNSPTGLHAMHRRDCGLWQWCIICSSNHFTCTLNIA